MNFHTKTKQRDRAEKKMFKELEFWKVPKIEEEYKKEDFLF